MVSPLCHKDMFIVEELALPLYDVTAPEGSHLHGNTKVILEGCGGGSPILPHLARVCYLSCPKDGIAPDFVV